jgi:hypothetical protein
MFNVSQHRQWTWYSRQPKLTTHSCTIMQMRTHTHTQMHTQCCHYSSHRITAKSMPTRHCTPLGFLECCASGAAASITHTRMHYPTPHITPNQAPHKHLPVHWAELNPAPRPPTPEPHLPTQHVSSNAVLTAARTRVLIRKPINASPTSPTKLCMFAQTPRARTSITTAQWHCTCGAPNVHCTER